jgi:hypothetical protein
MVSSEGSEYKPNGEPEMKTFASIAAGLVAAASALVLISPAHAQATRTWVSGVGDDVNPCSRTAPCKTFAGAISKTAAGGEINCLDPGGYGAVTIIKSITIDCYYTEGGALAGGNGIVVNLPAATDVVVLRGLDIFGVNPPSNGIRFIASGTLHVQNCRIKRFNAANSNGISFAPTGAAELFVSDTVISENGNGTTGAGIQIQPTGTGSAKVVINRVQVNNNIVGIRADAPATGGPINVSIDNSETSGNAFHGIVALTSGPSVQFLVNNTTSSQNADQGIRASGNANAIIRIGNSTITGNGTGTLTALGAQILSYGNNRINGNTVDGPNPPDIPEQ